MTVDLYNECKYNKQSNSRNRKKSSFIKSNKIKGKLIIMFLSILNNFKVYFFFNHKYNCPKQMYIQTCSAMMCDITLMIT